jgi:aspartate aminotransferase/aminotransferase
MAVHWIADRMRHIQASGIRQAFERARANPGAVNLSIGLPHFDVPEPGKAAAIEAIRSGQNQYSLTQGIPALREKLQADVTRRFPGQPDRVLMITSGSSGALLLGILATVNPGDEVVVFDPYFVMYNNIVTMAGGIPVLVDTYPDFRVHPARVATAITARTKAVILNSPCNPTGVLAHEEDVRALASLCAGRELLLISDEVYRDFCYEHSFVSPASFNPSVLVADGLSKSHGMTGWRLGYAHGPSALIKEMTKLQQFSFVCAPSMAQFGGVAALDFDLSARRDAYRSKRDRVVDRLEGHYELVRPEGAFYAFPKVPGAGESATAFCERAFRDYDLIIIPGHVFSRADTHFRISYAVEDDVLNHGLDILRQMA